VERLVGEEGHGCIVFEDVVLSPYGWLVIVGKHVLVVSENAVLVPLLVETAADDLGVSMMRGKVVPLVASFLLLVKVSLMLLLVVASALKHDLKPLLFAQGLLLLSLLLEVMAE